MSNGADSTAINDRYEIQKRVGRGGMADVFVARDRLLDRQVAVKVLFPEFAVDPNFVERFRREAQAAANLSHPNIVNVFDWGKYESTYFIAMEYVQGRTLAEILKVNKRLTPKQAAEIASEVAAALGFAHEAGLAHRDIKPANILIGSNGQVKVADFGIARAMNSATESNLTQAGAVMGTASYFSPEQAQGAQPDPRSDLYSLGIVMYEMVAGNPPFSGDNPVSVAYKQVHDQPTPLNKIVEGVPRAFEAIVAKLLAKDPAFRYSSSQELRDDLRRFRNGEPVHALLAATAAARPGTPAGGSQRPTTAVSTTPAIADQPQHTALAHPPIAGAPTTAMPSQPSPNLDNYPSGASADARYYQDNNSRTGWYALAAFIALIALLAGGLLLYQGLTDEGAPPSELTLDNYLNQPLSSVTAALDLLDLPYRVFAEENPLSNEDFVHRTVPAAGTVLAEGTVVELYFNPPKALKSIPNVAGLDRTEAFGVLSGDGFEYDELVELSDLAEGIVIRTNPAGGTRVQQTTVIVVVVSGGPNEVSIPSIVINKEVAVAKALLESDEYGLVVKIREQADEVVLAGIVINTEPGPNALVVRGGTVTLVVSSGPGQKIMPTLVGVESLAARNLLDQLGFIVTTTNREIPYADPRSGTVVEQSIPAGQLVDSGTVVNLVIGLAAPAPATTTSTTSTTSTTTSP